MQESGAEQPKVYRHTRTMLKIRSTPTEGEQTAQMKEWMTETRSTESNVPAFPYGTRDCAYENSQRYSSSNTVQLPLPRLDLPESEIFQKTGRKARLQIHCVQMILHWKHLMHKMHNAHNMHQGHANQHERTLESQPSHLVIFTCKDTIAPGLVDCQLKTLNFELYTYFVVF